ncbi:unnamed protein product [Lactuca virosa]|uniref:Uncharacterized protein n=1 Tax=Lactuca virosa TaxID=75947 RepID=A0AAU9M9R5_9ASTR|nr:unnamed protein product [Lactuca virosa]
MTKGGCYATVVSSKEWYGRSGLVVITKRRAGGELGFEGGGWRRLGKVRQLRWSEASSWPVVKKNGKGRER